jgi:SAM-dependent methyltransferase
MEQNQSRLPPAGDDPDADAIIQRLAQYTVFQPDWHLLEVTAADEAALLGHTPTSLDCVICRFGDHLPADPTNFVSACARVLRAGGAIAITCATVSGEPKIARFVNTLLKLRDPLQQWVYSLEDWDALLFSAGFRTLHAETFARKVDFDRWAAGAGVQGDDLLRLRVLIVQAPPAPREVLRPQQIGAGLAFTLSGSLIIARRE